MATAGGLDASCSSCQSASACAKNAGPREQGLGATAKRSAATPRRAGLILDHGACWIGARLVWSSRASDPMVRKRPRRKEAGPAKFSRWGAGLENGCGRESNPDCGPAYSRNDESRGMPAMAGKRQAWRSMGDPP